MQNENGQWGRFCGILNMLGGFRDEAACPVENAAGKQTGAVETA